MCKYKTKQTQNVTLWIHIINQHRQKVWVAVIPLQTLCFN